MLIVHTERRATKLRRPIHPTCRLLGHIYPSEDNFAIKTITKILIEEKRYEPHFDKYKVQMPELESRLTGELLPCPPPEVADGDDVEKPPRPTFILNALT